jgi:hypothetical protein
MLIISAIFSKWRRKHDIKKSVRQLYSGDESLSNLSTLWCYITFIYIYIYIYIYNLSNYCYLVKYHDGASLTTFTSISAH